MRSKLSSNGFAHVSYFIGKTVGSVFVTYDGSWQVGQKTSSTNEEDMTMTCFPSADVGKPYDTGSFWKDFRTAPYINYTCITVTLTLLHKERA